MLAYIDCIFFHCLKSHAYDGDSNHPNYIPYFFLQLGFKNLSFVNINTL